jgi:hypothetical protein
MQQLFNSSKNRHKVGKIVLKADTCICYVAAAAFALKSASDSSLKHGKCVPAAASSAEHAGECLVTRCLCKTRYI